MTKVDLYSRSGCHLCDIALETLEKLQKELRDEEPFEIEVILIDADPQLERAFGEQVPVTYIDGQPHDFWKVDPERFKKALRQRQ
ncbi:MAG: glutaredoxin family protein [Actinomycetes bacterium]|jgi:glutaredoxin